MLAQQLEQLGRKLGFHKKGALVTEVDGAILLTRKRRLGSFAALMLFVVGVPAAGIGGYLVYSSLVMPSPPVSSQSSPHIAKVVLAGLPSWAREVTVQSDHPSARRVALGGYLPTRAHSIELDAAMHQRGVQVDHLWSAVDEVSRDLSSRLGGLDGAVGARPPPTYAGQGRFVVLGVSADLEKIDPLIRRALQDMQAVQAIDLELTDRSKSDRSETGSPAAAGKHSSAIVHYVREEGELGGISVTGLEQLKPVQGLQRYDLTEMRLGRLPSIVLADGARYFEGSTLPGGALLLQIRPDHLMVLVGRDTSRVDIDANVLATANRSRHKGRPR